MYDLHYVLFKTYETLLELVEHKHRKLGVPHWGTSVPDKVLPYLINPIRFLYFAVIPLLVEVSFA